MKIVARQDQIERMERTLRRTDASVDGWSTSFVDVSTGEEWHRICLGSESHGGGMPILVTGPMPSVVELLALAAESADPAEVAASAWLLTETDPEGGYKERLVALAETAAREGDQSRAALLVGWGSLNDTTNLRSALRKHPDEVKQDHDHFKGIASRAQALLKLKATDPLLRDPKVFYRESRLSA